MEGLELFGKNYRIVKTNVCNVQSNDNLDIISCDIEVFLFQTNDVQSIMFLNASVEFARKLQKLCLPQEIEKI
jgi:hypothetical protein